jgi:hypothetical protein
MDEPYRTVLGHFDFLCMAVLAWFIARIALAHPPIVRRPLWLAHMAATAAAFVPTSRCIGPEKMGWT